MLFAGLLGALVTLYFTGEYNETPILVSGLLVSLTTLVTGWWVNVVVRHRAVLERVPMDHSASMHKCIDELVSSCLSSSTEFNCLLAELKKLANAIYGFANLLAAHQENFQSALQASMHRDYMEFKKHLTDKKNLKLAQQAGNRMRTAAFRLHCCYCRSIVEGGLF